MWGAGPKQVVLWNKDLEGVFLKLNLPEVRGT